MSQLIDRAGVYRGVIREYGYIEFPSGAGALNIYVDVHEFWDAENETWLDWRQYDLEAAGAIFITKKDGTLNQKQIEALVAHAGWDGNFESIGAATWKPTPCQFVVKEETYQNNLQLRISWINNYEGTPRAGLSSIDAAKAKELQTRYGSQLRALAGNAKRQETSPEGKPPTPPSPQSPAVSDEQKAAENASDDGIPF